MADGKLILETEPAGVRVATHLPLKGRSKGARQINFSEAGRTLRACSSLR
jgi:hypothetical protein